MFGASYRCAVARVLLLQKGVRVSVRGLVEMAMTVLEAVHLAVIRCRDAVAGVREPKGASAMLLWRSVRDVGTQAGRRAGRVKRSREGRRARRTGCKAGEQKASWRCDGSQKIAHFEPTKPLAGAIKGDPIAASETP